MKSVIKRIFVSFSYSAFSGLIVNLLIDAIVNGVSAQDGFISMSPEYVALFPTPVVAAYVNILLYGLIGAAFAGMSFVFEIDRIGYVFQNVIYFIGTSVVLTIITFVIWQLWKYPTALICTLCGYAASFLIMGVAQYRRLKRDVEEIDSILNPQTFSKM